MLKRNDIINKLSSKGYTKKDAGVILDDIFSLITEELISGESVQIHGFGTFRVKDCIEREVMSPRTKERIVVPAYKAAKFSPGELLKRAIKEGYIRK